MKIATGNELIAIKLHEFIHWYVPQGWVGPIHEFAFAPHFIADQIPTIKEQVKSGTLPYPWYITVAIIDFFKQKENENANEN